MNTYDFEGRVAIVTGGGQGIGLAVADRMLSGGAKIASGTATRLCSMRSTRFTTGAVFDLLGGRATY